MKKLNEILTVSECLELAKKYPEIRTIHMWYTYSPYHLALIYIAINPMCTNSRTIDRAILMLELINSRL